MKTIPFDPATNTPIFRTSPSTLFYRTFVNTFIACKAPFFRREHVLQLPVRHWLAGIAPPPEEFVAKENLNYDKSEKRASEGVVLADDEMVPTANLPPPPELAPHPEILRRDALTYDPSPVLNENNEYSVSAPDDQAELMHWHYRLGYALFTSLRQLARNGQDPHQTCQHPTAMLRRLPFWGYDQSSLAHQRVPFFIALFPDRSESRAGKKG